MSLFLLNENFVNSLSDNSLTIISTLSIICGILVIISKNPIVSVLFLIGLFLNIALYLITSGMYFIGLSYLLVYVGAVSILFLFILMLINVRVSELVTDNNNSIPLSVAIIIIFSYTFYDKIPSSNSSKILSFNNIFNTNTLYNGEVSGETNINFATSSNWDTALAEVSHITSIGNILYTSYPMLLLVTSLILLLAMVGAIVITIKQ